MKKVFLPFLIIIYNFASGFGAKCVSRDNLHEIYKRIN